jgi:hypothetical protein
VAAVRLGAVCRTLAGAGTGAVLFARLAGGVLLTADIAVETLGFTLAGTSLGGT